MKTNNKLLRTGIVGDMIKYRETRESFHTEENAIKVHYLEVIEKPFRNKVSDGNLTADISADFNRWRSEDDSMYHRTSEEDSEYQVENSETEEEEYKVEDYYKEVKRFSDLTEEEIDIVAEKLRNTSPKFEE